MRRRRLVLATGVVTAAATAAAITLNTSPGLAPVAAAGELPAYADCAQLSAHYRNAALGDVTAYGLGTRSHRAELYASPGAGVPGAIADDAAARAVGSSATGTNLQEQGVDEADLVKTDGRFVYAVGPSGVVVLDTRGAALRRVAGVPLRFAAQELLLSGARLLAIGTSMDAQPAEPGDYSTRHAPRPGSTRATLALIDVAKPEAPALLGSEEVDGAFVSARLTDGVARVVTASSPRLRFVDPWHYDRTASTPMSMQAAEDRATAANRAVVAGATEREWLPQRIRRAADGRVVSSGPLLGCQDVRHPRTGASYTTVSVRTIALGDADPLDTAATVGVTAAGETVYASADHLYVVTATGGWRGPARSDGRPVAGPDTVESVVHAFAADGRATRYVASGSVPGQVPGRWGLSEHDGRLRVVTTTQVAKTGRPAETSVSVLERRDDRLVAVGRVAGLGKDEQVYAVRFFGALGVVVTFRQTDPLYTLDLSDPRRPRVTGELKIPGYSAYLHPVGDRMLLGIGQDADEKTGRARGLQAALFDLSDLERPRRVVHRLLGQSEAGVQHDSRAFAYLPSTGTAVMPTMTWHGGWQLAVLGVGAAAGRLDVAARLPTVEGATRSIPVGDAVVVIGAQHAALVSVRGPVRTLGTAALT